MQMCFGDGIFKQFGKLRRDECNLFAGRFGGVTGVCGGNEQVGRNEQGQPSPATGPFGQFEGVAEARGIAARLEVSMGQCDGVFGYGQTVMFIEEPGICTNLLEDLDGLASGDGTQMFFEGSGEFGGGFVENGCPSLLTSEVARGLLK